MSQRLPVDGFKWRKDKFVFNEEFGQDYYEDNDNGYILEVEVKYLKELHELQKDLPFLPERMKIDKRKKPACNLYDKKNILIHIKALKQGLEHELIPEKYIR